MRKPRDYESELKALAEKAKRLKERRVQQLGELVIATGSDSLDPDILAGALLDAATSKDATTQAAWRKRGAMFFDGRARSSDKGDAGGGEGIRADASGATQA